ncbi:pyrophosphatase PpaX [Acidaminobacter hydrogenoformans DSM 2784]|uniref:Pyrophosphatase PpaX n=2 Tax=Acidaminobacter TaxID=65402 RepID=A0A1G5S4U5_9FIRM|nr:pyrophosphatase PpaX [Acidaminobacter hydrogenoformans DSM 2784]
MIDTIIFDFDGTIIDTNFIIERGLNLFSRAYRGTRLSPKELEQLTGRPLFDQMAAIQPHRAEEMTDRFRKWYAQRHDELTQAFNGMDELFEDLRQLDFKLAIVTNNSREGVQMGLEHLGMNHLFQAVITCDDVLEKKPSPEGVHLALKLLNARPEEAIFIGDSSGDLIASRRAGVVNVLVGWSSIKRELLLTHQPDFIIEHPLELLEVVSLMEQQIA